LSFLGLGLRPLDQKIEGNEEDLGVVAAMPQLLKAK